MKPKSLNKAKKTLPNKK